jgi:hypothetical protein
MEICWVCFSSAKPWALPEKSGCSVEEFVLFTFGYVEATPPLFSVVEQFGQSS